MPDPITWWWRSTFDGVIDMHAIRSGLHDHIVTSPCTTADPFWCSYRFRLLDEWSERVSSDRYTNTTIDPTGGAL